MNDDTAVAAPNSGLVGCIILDRVERHAGVEFVCAYASEFSAMVLGWSRESLLGRTPADVVRPQVRERVNAFFASVAGEGAPRDLPLVEWESPLAVLGLRAVAYPLGDGLAILLHDATPDLRNVRERQLREIEERTILDSIPLPVWVKDRDRRYIAVNRAWTETLGISESRVIGRTTEDLFPPQVAAPMRESDEVVLQEQRFLESTGELDHESAAGHYLVFKSPLFDGNGTLIGLLGMARNISDLRRYQSQIEYYGTHDLLTGLANRSLLADRSEQAISYSKRYRRRTAFVYLDLDNFKYLNDSMGSPLADEFLKEIASRLREIVRFNDTIARVGGDEFVLVLTDQESAGTTSETLNRILTSVREPVRLDNRDITVTASIGCSICPDDGDDPDILLRRAAAAMQRTKQSGRDSAHFFAPGVDSEATEWIELMTDLRRGVKSGQLLLHYQPQLDLRTGLYSGVEALMRWQHPSRGMIPPNRFIPIAEDSALIVEMGAWALHEACRQIVAWNRDGISVPSVAVNLSARQFRDAGLVDFVQGTLEETGMTPERLELEITESLVMHDADQAIRILSALKELGAQVAIDDFGTGYSSLNYLRRFPVDKLKLDRSFVRDVEQVESAATVARAVIGLGHSLGLKVVAEGVETQAQLEFLRRNDCDEIQGYLISRPLPTREAGRVLGATPNLPRAA